MSANGTTALSGSCFLAHPVQNNPEGIMNTCRPGGKNVSPRPSGDALSQPGLDDGKLDEHEQETRKIRRLQLMISMVMSVIGQDPTLTLEEASELAAGAKRAALAMFPDKELAFDLLYKPRLQRLMLERYRLQ
jgi:hypothetical protein